jgi:biotin carboxyl carrier protein
MRYFVNIDGEEHVVELAELPGGQLQVRLLESADADASAAPAVPAEISHTAAGITVRIAGKVYDVVLDGELPSIDAWVGGRRAQLHVETARMRAAAQVKSPHAAGADGVVKSPMPGKVVKVLVGEGDEVEPGMPLVVVEAMKMENELTSPRAGVVRKIHAAPGDTVEGGAKLVTVG